MPNGIAMKHFGRVARSTPGSIRSTGTSRRLRALDQILDHLALALAGDDKRNGPLPVPGERRGAFEEHLVGPAVGGLPRLEVERLDRPASTLDLGDGDVEAMAPLRGDRVVAEHVARGRKDDMCDRAARDRERGFKDQQIAAVGGGADDGRGPQSHEQAADAARHGFEVIPEGVRASSGIGEDHPPIVWRWLIARAPGTGEDRLHNSPRRHAVSVQDVIERNGPREAAWRSTGVASVA